MKKENTRNGQITPNDKELRGVDWEAQLNDNLRAATKRATRLNYVLAAIIILMAIGYIVLLPLKQVVPYLERVDEKTGVRTVIQTTQNYVSQDEMNDKHWIKEFVIARERYNYRLLQHDYNTVKILAGEVPWKEYDEKFAGRSALDRQFGENVQISPEVVSITLTKHGEQKFATVRLKVEQRDMRSDSLARTVFKVATLRYDYQPPMFVKEATAIENPYGFVVLGYQTDSELAGGAQ